MTLRRKSTKAALWLVAAAILAAAGPGARAQTPSTNDEVKILRCRQDPMALIFMSREQLLARCGMWSKTYTVKAAGGDIERIVYSRYFVVNVRKGQVSSVRQRRQIFTGFGKER